jgi:hypothetical protein
MKKFSDFAETPKVLDGKKVKIEDVVDKEIEIIGYRIEKSKYNGKSEMYLTIQFEWPEQDGRFVLFTGSTVLLEQFEKYAEEIPFAATIRKVDKFFTLS